MQNRKPRYPGRIKLTPIDAANGIYDLTRADEPEVVGTPLAKKLLDYAVAACGVTAGTSTAYTLDGELVDGFTLSDGAKVNFKLHAASGANATLNVGGTGAKPIQSFFGSGITLPAGVWITAVYSADKDAFLTASDANTTTRIAIFTTSQSVTIPENIYGSAHVLMFGGGGGTWNSSGDWGGSGGGYMEEFDTSFAPGETYDIVIGAAGVNGSSDGGATLFDGHTAAGGKRPTQMYYGGDGGSGGGSCGIQNTTPRGGNAQYGGGGGTAGTYGTEISGNGGNGGTYGGGGGAHYNGTAGTGGTYGGNGGRMANGAPGTSVNGISVVYSPWFLLLCKHFGKNTESTQNPASGGAFDFRNGGGGGGYGGNGGNATVGGNSTFPGGSGGGGGYGCDGGDGGPSGYQHGSGGGGGGYGDDGADAAADSAGGGGGFFGIAARGAGGSFGKTAQSGCVCIIYRTVEV